MPRLGSGNLTMGIYVCPCCMLILFLENNVFDEWDAIYLLLMNNVIVFIRLVLSEDLRVWIQAWKIYVYAECDLLLILLLMT